MSIVWFLVLVFLAYAIITGPSRKKKKRKEKEELKKQLLNLFTQNDHLLAAEVGERLEERTGRRKLGMMFKIIPALESLVEEGKLHRKESVKNMEGHEVKNSRYSLPQK